MSKSVFTALAAALAITAGSRGAEPVHYAGEAVIRNVGTNRIAIFLDSNADEKIDHGFLLSSDLPIASDLSVECPESRIDFTDGWARLVSGTKVYDLYVAGYPEPPASPAKTDVRRFTGYALVHSSGDSGCSLERALEKDPGVCYRYGDD